MGPRVRSDDLSCDSKLGLASPNDQHRSLEILAAICSKAWHVRHAHKATNPLRSTTARFTDLVGVWSPGKNSRLETKHPVCLL